MCFPRTCSHACRFSCKVRWGFSACWRWRFRRCLESESTPDEFQNFREAPLAKIAMNFRLVERDAAHCTVITETRVYAGGAPVVRRVAAYWRVIYPGSALMRHIWLRAIKLRAEGAK